MDDENKAWEEIFTVNGKIVKVYSPEADVINEENDNVDIFVDYDGLEFAGNIMTPTWIEEYLATNTMSDVGWHCDHDLILPNLSRSKIVEAISSLVERDELKYAFILCE